MDLLHIGGDAMADLEDVIVIISRETALRSRDTRRAIDAAIGRDRIRSASDAPQKAYVLMEQAGSTAVWSSPLSPITLLKRAGRPPAARFSGAED